MKKVISFEHVNSKAAGIDIGSEKIFVSVDGMQVSNFGTYTQRDETKKGKENRCSGLPMDTAIVFSRNTKESFMPEGMMLEICYLVRVRLAIIEMGSAYVHKMQRCLELMNIKLTEALSQIHGTSGMKMLKAIVKGERGAQQLLLLCDARIRKQKGPEIFKALEGIIMIPGCLC